MRVVTDPETFRETARKATQDTRIPVELRVCVADPFDAYRRARCGNGGDVFLETTGGQSGWGYFATDPITRVSVSTPSGGTAGSPSIDAIRQITTGEAIARGSCDIPYPCGVFGWLSYDIVRELEALPSTTVDDRGLPRLQLAKYDRVASWTEPWTGEVTLRVTACPRVGDHSSITAAYEWGVKRARDLVARAIAGDRSVGRGIVEQRQQVSFEAECSRREFADRVRQVKAYIRAGDTFQANISQRLSAPATIHPVKAYAALRRVNPAPYSALVEFPGVDLVSASPELLLEVDGNRLVTEPIAGTRPRGGTAEDDAALEAALRSDEKERAEHAMLVDLERNDLGKVSQYGSVAVDEYRRVDRYSEVMHLVSRVKSQRRDDCGLADAVAAVFPGGTVTGAPKPRTMEIIDEMETSRRGPYTGAIGVFGFDDRATLNIIIRTLVRHGEQYYLRVGAGIVHDSDPDREYEETLDKGRALVTAINTALEGDAAVTVEATQ